MDENMMNETEEQVSATAEQSSFATYNASPTPTVAEEKKANVKIIAIIAAALATVAIFTMFVLSGKNGESGGNDNTGNVTGDTKETQFEAANDAYNDIMEASEICIDIMDSIYGAWYFAIYKADDYSGFSKLNQFCSETNLSYTDVNAAMEELGISSTNYYIFEEFSYAVHIVKTVYETKGTYTKATDLLSSAKESLKKVTNEYSDYTGYPTLKSYYSEVSSYLEFAKSPSGSFSQLKTTIDNYETNMRTYKNDLSFIFE